MAKPWGTLYSKWPIPEVTCTRCFLRRDVLHWLSNCNTSIFLTSPLHVMYWPRQGILIAFDPLKRTRNLAKASHFRILSTRVDLYVFKFKPWQTLYSCPCFSLKNTANLTFGRVEKLWHLCTQRDTDISESSIYILCTENVPSSLDVHVSGPLNSSALKFLHRPNL